jgi:hypothetical protein
MEMMPTVWPSSCAYRENKSAVIWGVDGVAEGEMDGIELDTAIDFVVVEEGGVVFRDTGFWDAVGWTGVVNVVVTVIVLV